MFFSSTELHFIKFHLMPNNVLQKVSAATACGALLLILAGCGKKAPQTGGLEKASLRLAWVYDMSEVGIFVARDHGFYKEAGIDLEIKPGGFGLDPMRLVAAGGDTFGVGGAVNLLLAREKGLPLVAVAAEFQETPVCFITRKDSGINNFADFKGHKVGVQTGADTDTIFRALLNKFGMSSSDLTEVPIQFDPTPFVSGQIDVLPGYVSNQPITLGDRGIKTTVITAASQGLNIYGNVYFVNEQTLTKNPDLVRHFLAATRKGWELAISSPETAIESIKARSKDFNDEDLRKIYTAVIPYIEPQNSRQAIFKMTATRWIETYHALKQSGISTRTIDVSKAFKVVPLNTPNG